MDTGGNVTGKFGEGQWRTAAPVYPTLPNQTQLSATACDSDSTQEFPRVNSFLPLKISYEAKFDGKDYPVTGDPSSDSVSYQRINANTLKGKTKKDGKVATDATIVVSKDGKITTVRYTDYSQAKPAEGTAVYDKQ